MPFKLRKRKHGMTLEGSTGDCGLPDGAEPEHVWQAVQTVASFAEQESKIELDQPLEGSAAVQRGIH